MKNRWTALIAGVMIQIILGGIYAWSTLLAELGETYGITKGQGGFIFGLCITTFTLTMVFAGRFLVVHGPRLTASIGAALFTFGYLVASLSKGNYLLLLLGLGIFTGAGIGFGYVCPLSVGIKWFPQAKGLITGISVAGFGSGAILLSSVAGYLLGNGMPILVFLLLWGLLSGFILFVASLFMSEPPNSNKAKPKRATMKEVFSIQFMVCAIGIFAGTFAGLLINGNLLPLVEEGGIERPLSLISISLFAVGNTFGRIVWGHLFDRVGYKSIPISLFGLAFSSLVLLVQLPQWVLLSTICLIGFFFGSNFVIYASSIARYFGNTLFSTLYPICFVAYGIAGFIAPGIGGYFDDLTGSFHTSLIGTFVIILVAGIFSVVKLDVFRVPVAFKKIE
ncbi:MAG: MFS transporter [Spirochaetia bacterium]|nr:MFS transporter [Spirochaetia bacterium]